MQLSLARNFAKGIDLGKRAWIPLAEASTVPAGDTHNQLGEAPGPIASSSECVLMHARHVARSWYHWRCYHRVQTRDPRHSPHSDGSVPGQDRYEIMASICSKPASKWTPIWLREGSQCPHSRSRRRVFRRTHPQYLAPPGDALQSGADASRHALHGDGRAPGVPFRPRQPDAGEGGGLESFRP